MSEIKPVSPLMDGLSIGECFSNRAGTQCCFLTRSETAEQFVLKHIAIPESEEKTEALILTGAVADEAGANNYYKTVAEDIIREAETLQALGGLGILAAPTGRQLSPREGVGFDVDILMPRRKSLQSFLQEKAITQLQALNFGIDLCDALSALRDEGYLYQNLKPENIFINEKGQFRIGDLGLLRLEDLSYGTVPEHWLNDFSAPEFFELLAAPNGTADIYALGMILYYIFNGNHLPFDDAKQLGAEARRARLKTEALPAPKYADYELAEMIARACDPDPAKRYASPNELRQALTLYMQRNEVHDHLLVPPLPLAEAKDADVSADKEALPEEEVPEEEVPEDETPEDEAPEEEAPEDEVPEEAQAEEVPAASPATEEAPKDIPKEGEDLDEFLASVSDVLSERADDAPTAPDLDANEAASRQQEKPKKRKKVWFPILILAFALILIGSGAYYFYTNWYLVTMDGLTVTSRTADSITVSYLLSAPDPELSWQCTDTYGNSFPGAAGEGAVRFTGLTPGTQYNISFYPGRLHKLMGTTLVSAATEAQTQIVTLTAAPGGNTTTAEVSMVVSGPEPAQWTLTYSSEGSDSGSVTFSGHSVLIPGLRLHDTYTFELQAAENIYLTGQTQCELRMQADVQAKDLQVSFATKDSLTITWENLADEPLCWVARCVGDGYDKTLEVTDCAATFPGIDMNKGYTFTVAAEGMEVPLAVSLPANAMVITSLEAEPQDAGSVLVTWASSEAAPENGWVVRYRVSGDASQSGSLAVPEEQSAILSGLPANAEIEITLEPASGDSVIGSNTLTVMTSEAGGFTGHDFVAADSELSLYPLPEEEEWSFDDLGDAIEETSVGASLAVVLQAPEGYKSRDKDETAITIVFRDANGKIGKYLAVSCTWNDIWRESRYMTSTKAPATEGSYQVELYFDNLFVSSQVIKVSAPEQSEKPGTGEE